MKKWTILVVSILVVGLVLGSISVVSAGTGTNAFKGFGGRIKNAFERGFKLGVRYNLNEDIANYLGITLDTLKSEIKSGKSLATIATEHGKSESDLINFIVSKEKAYLDTALKNGKITQEQYNNMVANLEARVKERVEKTPQVKNPNP